MTARTANKICRFIADGLPLQHAAALGGISKSSFHVWQNKNPKFAEAVEHARAAGLSQRLSVIAEAATTDWRAAAWYAEHVFPDSFAKSRVQLEHIGMVEHSFAVPRDVLDSIADARKEHHVEIEIK